MGRPEESPRKAQDGFEGEVAGLGLSDIIQLNARSRFSGCFRIRNGDLQGLIFFRDGDIIHAEQGKTIGEEAFCEILGWPAGRFSVEPNVVTARKTIQKRCEHLLLDAHRVLDERRAHLNAGMPGPLPRASTPASPADLVRSIPGVSEVAVLAHDGRRIGDEGYASEALAGQTMFLAMLGAELGQAFQTSDLRFASIQGEQKHLLVYTAKSHYLGVLAEPGSEIGTIDATIRNILASGPGQK